MTYVFGPVPSRRLGKSLGIDTVPMKTCNWNCVYCQLGRSTPVVHERKEYLPAEAILDEVRQALPLIQPRDIDWITFVASGEGTLHSRIGTLVHAVKRMSDHPVAVITNGSMLYLADVRAGMAEADAVLPTLDAGDPALYRRINRPHPQFTFAQHVAGLTAFAQMKRHAKMWIEVMLVAGVNDTELALRQLSDVLSRIGPDEVQLTLPTRCPAEDWVHPPDAEGLMRAQAILGPKARLMSTSELAWAFSRDSALEDQIVSIASRHPLKLTDLEYAARDASGPDLHRVLDRLCAGKRLQVIRRFEEIFVCAGDACFGQHA
jgi:wyosine [tRNA(Phe)-imidazoG37] synthetase (radical SAM superfamily)